MRGSGVVCLTIELVFPYSMDCQVLIRDTEFGGSESYSGGKEPPKPDYRGLGPKGVNPSVKSPKRGGG